jgi:uncharacterized membrane protein
VWYRVVLLIHILAGIAWLGGGLAIEITQQRALRAGGRAAFDRVRRDLAWADTWLAIPAPLLVVATGIAMVLLGPGWRFSQTWIWMAIAILIAYQGLAFTVGARLYRRLESGDGAPGRGDPGISLLRLGRLLLLMLVAILALMVFKPGG